jgi:ABC-type polysaccharide/polyol phosphate export permease
MALPSGAGRGRRPELFAELVLQELRALNAGSVIGVGWAVVQPLLVLAAYWFLLTVLGSRTLGPGDTTAQLAYLFAALVPWLLMSRGITGACTALTRHAGLVKNVNFPLEVLPFATVGSYAVDYLVGLATLLILVAVAGLLGAHELLLVPASALMLAFLTALAVALGPVAVMFRDLPRLLAFALRLGIFLTPVLYLPDNVPGGLTWVVELNPLTYFVGLVRYAATGLDGSLVHGLGADFAIAAGVTAAAILISLPMRRFARREALDHL